jgi:hypothetical protein
VTGTEFILDVAIVFRALILVADQETNRGARGKPFKYARKYFDLVGLISLCCVPRPAWPPALKIRLDILSVKRHPRRAAINDAAERDAMAFTKGRYDKILTNTVAGH